MQRGERIWLFSFILIPILLSLLFRISPRPWSIARSMDDARLSRADNHTNALISYLKTSVEFYPWRADLWEQRGINELISGNAAQALISLQQAANMSGLTPSGWLSLGDTYLQMNDIPSAIQTWKAQLAFSGASDELYGRLSQVYQTAGDSAQALQILEDWAAWNPKNGKVLYRLGLYQSIYQPEMALSTLLEAADADPGVTASVQQVRSALVAGDQEKNQPYQLVLVGRSLGALGEWSLAEEAFNRACQLAPEYAEAWAFLGEARQQTGKDGTEALERAVSLAPDSLLVQALRALSWRREGRMDLALVSLHAIADRESQNGLWQLELGNTLVQMGDLPSALTYFQKAVQLEPQNPVYWRALAAFSVRYGISVSDVGLEAARQAVALSPEDPQSLDVMAQVMMVSGDLVSASRFLERALKLQPDFALASLHLGLILLQQGERDRAFQALSDASRYGSGSNVGIQARRLIAQNFPESGKSP